jgi:cyclic pyranopterin phosphate synthase
MVHVGDKSITARRAVAEGFVHCNPALLQRVLENDLAKGSLLQVARIAGIQAAKRTAELIPLCHPVPLESVNVDLRVDPNGIAIRAEALACWKTGVEMEALTAVAVAALTVIDMGKAVDRTMVIDRIRLLEKTGGTHGDFRAEEAKQP